MSTYMKYTDVSVSQPYMGNKDASTVKIQMEGQSSATPGPGPDPGEQLPDLDLMFLEKWNTLAGGVELKSLDWQEEKVDTQTGIANDMMTNYNALGGRALWSKGTTSSDGRKVPVIVPYSLYRGTMVFSLYDNVYTIEYGTTNHSHIHYNKMGDSTKHDEERHIKEWQDIISGSTWLSGNDTLMDIITAVGGIGTESNPVIIEPDNLPSHYMIEELAGILTSNVDMEIPVAPTSEAGKYVLRRVTWVQLGPRKHMYSADLGGRLYIIIQESNGYSNSYKIYYRDVYSSSDSKHDEERWVEEWHDFAGVTLDPDRNKGLVDAIPFGSKSNKQKYLSGTPECELLNKILELPNIGKHILYGKNNGNNVITQFMLQSLGSRLIKADALISSILVHIDGEKSDPTDQTYSTIYCWTEHLEFTHDDDRWEDEWHTIAGTILDPDKNLSLLDIIDFTSEKYPYKVEDPDEISLLDNLCVYYRGKHILLAKTPSGDRFYGQFESSSYTSTSYQYDAVYSTSLNDTTYCIAYSVNADGSKTYFTFYYTVRDVDNDEKFFDIWKNMPFAHATMSDYSWSEQPIYGYNTDPWGELANNQGILGNKLVWSRSDDNTQYTLVPYSVEGYGNNAIVKFVVGDKLYSIWNSGGSQSGRKYEVIKPATRDSEAVFNVWKDLLNELSISQSFTLGMLKYGDNVDDSYVMTSGDEGYTEALAIYNYCTQRDDYVCGVWTNISGALGTREAIKYPYGIIQKYPYNTQFGAVSVIKFEIGSEIYNIAYIPSAMSGTDDMIITFKGVIEEDVLDLDEKFSDIWTTALGAHGIAGNTYVNSIPVYEKNKPDTERDKTFIPLLHMLMNWGELGNRLLYAVNSSGQDTQYTIVPYSSHDGVVNYIIGGNLYTMRPMTNEETAFTIDEEPIKAGASEDELLTKWYSIFESTPYRLQTLSDMITSTSITEESTSILSDTIHDNIDLLGHRAVVSYVNGTVEYGFIESEENASGYTLFIKHSNKTYVVSKSNDAPYTYKWFEYHKTLDSCAFVAKVQNYAKTNFNTSVRLFKYFMRDNSIWSKDYSIENAAFYSIIDNMINETGVFNYWDGIYWDSETGMVSLELDRWVIPATGRTVKGLQLFVDGKYRLVYIDGSDVSVIVYYKPFEKS